MKILRILRIYLCVSEFCIKVFDNRVTSKLKMAHDTVNSITLLSYNHVYIYMKISFANLKFYLFVCFSSQVFFNNLFRTAACRKFESTLSPDGIPHIRTVSASFCRMARFFYKPATLIRGTSGITRYYGKYVKKVAPSTYSNYFQ